MPITTKRWVLKHPSSNRQYLRFVTGGVITWTPAANGAKRFSRQSEATRFVIDNELQGQVRVHQLNS